jgi:hypothetical protein
MAPARLLLAWATGAMALNHGASADVIHRRGGESSITAEIASVNDAGVTIRRNEVESELIRWDRIRRS